MTELQQSAQAVCNRWDSPDWSDGTHTVEYINRLRKAIEVSNQTVRDQFATAALQGICTNAGRNGFEFDKGQPIAMKAYELADAMMEARKK